MADNEIPTLTTNKSGPIFRDIQFSEPNKMPKAVSALIDTGSDLCLVRYYTLVTLQLDNKMDKERQRFVGIGSSEQITIGSFTILMMIDDIE